MLKSDEAQIIREGEDTPKLYATFVKAVQEAQDGDVIQLLPDTLESESGPKNRVIKLQETATIKSSDSIIIDLNQQELNFSETSSDKAYILIQPGAELTVKGPGRMTGGYVNNNLTGLNETIWVGTTANKAQLTITEGAYVEGIKNYGVTKVINGAQVSQIAHLKGSNPAEESFTLDTKLENSLKVVLDAVESSKLYSKVWLTVGKDFSIDENVKIDFSLSNSGTPREAMVNSNFKKWLNTETADNTISLIKNNTEIPVSVDIINKLAKITSVINKPTEKTTFVASECIIGGNVVLFKNNGFVYLGGENADDGNVGYSNEEPVATMSKAIDLAKNAKKQIYIVGTVKVTKEQGEQIWDLPGDIGFELSDDFAQNGRSGPFAEVELGGELTLKHVILDGSCVDEKAKKINANSPLIKVDKNGILNIEDGAELKNNEYQPDVYYKNGGAIASEGGFINISGGTISKCFANNGGAIYCEGGELNIKGGIFEENHAREAGGAVMLANGAHMTLDDGRFEGNYVREVLSGGDWTEKGYGGAIAVGGARALSVKEKPILTMNGGVITHNTAYTCGGGIFIQCGAEADIYGGTIGDKNLLYGNRAMKGMYGGGGIYVNGGKNQLANGECVSGGTVYADGVLRLNAKTIISGNGAYDVGGGIAGCPTSNISISPLTGAVFYGNNGYTNGGSKQRGSDIFIGRDLSGSSLRGIFATVHISHYAPDGTPYLWKDENGELVAMSGPNENTSNYLLHLADLDRTRGGLDLHTDISAATVDTSGAKIFIVGNNSENKGGGIGSNGTVIIGTEPTTISVTAQKVWNDAGHTNLRPDQITVGLFRKPKEADDSEYMHVATEYLKPIDNKEDVWDTVTFGNQPTSLNGVEYEYKVEEMIEGSEPYPYAITTELESDNNWVITNTYTPTGTATVSATKKLTGRAKALEDDEFSFSLTKVSALDKDNKPITDSNADQTKTNTGEAVNFDTLNYTQAGTYTYTLKEEETDKGGITKDSTVYTVTVKMEDDDAGHLIPTVTYKKGNDEVPAAEVVFTNQYTATGTATVSATKKLNGRAKTLENGEFSFSLTKVSAVDKDDKSITDPNANQTKTNTGEAVNFDTLNYTQAGTYTYTLKEEETDKGGIKKDPTVYTVTVKMEDDDAGHLTPTVTYKKGDKEVSAAEVVFTNQYTATGTATVSVTKKLNGRAKALEDGEFSFSLTKVSALDKDNKPITDSNADQTKTNKGEAINFDTLNYTQVGTYTYTLKEEETDKGGITKDSTVYTVTVEMEDDDAGHLTPTVTYKKGDKEVSAAEVVFTNQYTATGTATVSATKKLNGRAKALEDGEFSFSLTKVSALDKDNKPITDSNADQTKTNKGEAINFDTLNYTQAGTYTYTLKEEETDKGGIKKDPTVYTVIVEMEDNDEGHLTQTVTYKKGDAEVSAEDVIFTNQYTAIGTATVSATKTLTGRANGLQDKEFSFSLTPVSAVAADGKTEITDPNMDAETNPGGMLTASNDGDGNVTFEKLTYTQAGTYTYELKEEATAEAGITKDPAVYTVTVSVTDDGLGSLLADVKYSKDGKEVAAADVAFENVYDAEDTSIRLRATKVFDRALTDGEFTFVLQEVDQDGHAVADGITREAVNGKDGSVLFDPIPYDKEGTYYYQISETAGNDPTVLAYDAAVYTVTVTVKDVDAKLVATAVSPDKVTFTNTSTKAYIDKQDAETGAGIPGAVLRIVDKNNGAVVEEWTSDGKPHEVLGKLSKNGSYALEEVSAPDGYMPTGPVDFTMNEKGETVVDSQITDTVVMKDTKNTISLLKLDETGQPLPGAHLVIEDATGTAVDNWVSDGTPHVTRGLARGHYVMSEVEAPAGYHVSEDVPFEITGNETQPVEVQMTDTKIPERDNNKLTVMKHLQLDGITCDIGIHDAVFYVALFDDEAKTHRVSDVKALTFKDSAISTAEFENLGKGTYYLGETDENGVLKESEVVNDRVIYYAQYGENAKVEFEGRKGEATADLTNVYVEVPEQGFYLSGRLTITKKVLLNGTEATSEDTFYARVFSDAALTSPNSDVVALAMNGGSTASVTVYDLPIGETLESSATYYVAETDKNGTPLDPDVVTEYRISIDKSEIVLNAENSNQEVTITNDFIEEEDETETETDLPDEPGATPNSGTSAPKTGDETNLLLYLFYMMLSAGLFAAAAGEKRRRRNRVKK